MNIKRVLATGLSAIMLGSTLAIGGLAQTATPAASAAPGGNLPWTISDSATALMAYAGTDASSGSVVLSGAAENEVLAAANGLDLTKTTFADAIAKVRDTAGAVKPGTAAGGAAAGTTTGGTTKFVNFGVGTAGGTLLSAGTSAYPTGVWTSSVVPQLQSGKISWKGNDYDWKEVMSTTGVRMRNDVGTSDVNGTITVEIDNSPDIYFAYRFDKAINITTANSKGNKETESFELADPIPIKFLGKDFQIVAIAAGKIVVLNGAIGKSITDITPVKYTSPTTNATYSVYAIQGSDNSWAKVSIKDATGAEVGSGTINKGASQDFDNLGITVQVNAVRATQDNKISGADIVVGPKGKVQKTIDTSADTSSTSTSNDALFDGFPDWGLQTSGTLANGQAEINDELRLIYKPTSTKFLKKGEYLRMPNGMAFGAEGYNTANFAKITMKPFTGYSALNISDTTQSFGNLNGVEISSDVGSTVGGAGGNYYSKMAIFFNKTRGPGTVLGNFPVLIGYYDGSNWKVNGTLVTLGSNQVQSAGHIGGFTDANQQGRDAVSYLLNNTNDGATTNNGNFTYQYKLNYGGASERTWFVNTSVYVFNSSLGTTPIASMILGRAGATGDTTARYVLNISWRNKTVWGEGSNAEFRLGPNTGSADTEDIKVGTEASTEQGIGTKTQDEILDNSGIIVATPSTYTASDTVVIKLPDKELQAAVYVGSKKSTGTVVGTPKYATPADVAAQLKAGTLASSVILVGGPCANEAVEYLAAASATDALPTCAEWVGGAAPKYTKGLIGVWAVGTTNKKALVIAGTAKADTDTLAGQFKSTGVTYQAPA